MIKNIILSGVEGLCDLKNNELQINRRDFALKQKKMKTEQASKIFYKSY